MKRRKLFTGTMVNRNPGLYSVEFWKRDTDEPGWSLDHMRSGGSKRWAELCAADILSGSRVVTTNGCYHRDMGRADYCTVICPDGKKFTIEPKCEIVPSVGELGYW